MLLIQNKELYKNLNLCLEALTMPGKTSFKLCTQNRGEKCNSHLASALISGLLGFFFLEKPTINKQFPYQCFCSVITQAYFILHILYKTMQTDYHEKYADSHL